MEIIVKDLQKKIKIGKKWVKKTAGIILRKLRVNGELNIVLADNKYIKRLNRKYRHKNRATDVLSFHGEGGMIGDIIISAERAKTQAGKYGNSFLDEMRTLIRHGILHLRGYTHKEMKKLQCRSIIESKFKTLIL